MSARRSSHDRWRGPSFFARWSCAPIVLLLIGSCTSVSTTLVDPSRVTCAVTPSSSLVPVAATGGVVSINVTAFPECAWTAATQASWITDLAPAAGQGSGELQARVGANPSSSPRHADVLLNQASVRLMQDGAVASPDPQPVPTPPPAPTVPAPSPGPAPTPEPAPPTPSPSPSPTPTPPPSACTFAVTPTRFDVDHTATSGLEVQVTAGAGCTWSAISHDTWVAVTAGASGSGSGPVVFDVSANVLGGRRVGTLTIAGTTVEVRQERWRLFP